MAEINQFNTWQAAFRELARRLEQQKPLTGPGVRLETTARGIRIHAAAVSGSENYRGYFRVSGEVEDGNRRLTILDGAAEEAVDDPAATVAGFAIVNDQLIELPGEALTTTLESGAVFAGFELLSSGVVTFSAYEAAAEVPANSGDAIYFLLATFQAGDGGISVIQQHHGRLYGWIFRECETEEEA